MLVTLQVFTLLLVSQAAWSKSIAMVLWRGETEAEKGFKEQLTLMGYTPHFTIFNAEQNKTTLGKILRVDLRPHLDQYDYIYTFGTTISKATQQTLNGKKPHLFNIVADPIGAGLVSHQRGGTKNIAGSSNAVDHEALIKAAKTKLALTTLAVPFNPKEKNSKLQLNQITTLGEKYGYKTIPVRVNPDKNIYLDNIKTILQQPNIDAVYFLPDSFMISHSKHIMPLLTSAQLPTICSTAKYIKNGCFMGIGADYYTLGKQVAILLDRHAKSGEALESMAIQFDQTPRLLINEKTQQALGM